MKKTIVTIILIFVALIAMFFIFNKKDITKDNQDNKIKVAATIFPLYDLVRSIGGEKVEAILILPPGASPHTYEVSPAKVKETQDVSLLFTIGAGVDSWAEKLIQEDDVRVVSLEESVSLKPFKVQGHDHEDEHEDEHEHGDLDPHYWLSPNNAILIVQKISIELSLLDPENGHYYLRNADNFISELEIKNAEWEDKISKLNKKELVVFHDAWGYFADYFGLEIVATFEPFPGKTPTPQYLIKLQEEVKENNIKSLFVEPQLSKEAISTLAQDLGVEVAILDPIGGLAERGNYLDLISSNVNNIYNALSK